MKMIGAFMFNCFRVVVGCSILALCIHLVDAKASSYNDGHYWYAKPPMHSTSGTRFPIKSKWVVDGRSYPVSWAIQYGKGDDLTEGSMIADTTIHLWGSILTIYGEQKDIYWTVKVGGSPYDVFRRNSSGNNVFHGLKSVTLNASTNSIGVIGIGGGINCPSDNEPQNVIIYRMPMTETDVAYAVVCDEVAPVYDGGWRYDWIDYTVAPGAEYYYWAKAVGRGGEKYDCKVAMRKVKAAGEPITCNIIYENLLGAVHANKSNYAQGTSFRFVPPSDVAGKVFTGWTPAEITEYTKGDLNVKANWSDNKYCVVDLSQGPESEKYPVSYLCDVPVGGWTKEYKTNKLVLRQIQAGSFLLNGKYKAQLTHSYFIGVFEVTQKQYELVMGEDASMENGKGDVRPVDMACYSELRGADLGKNWPASPKVDANSFFGKLQDKTGLRFDLPTEAQWEYACRTGESTNQYNFAGNSTDDSSELGQKMCYAASSIGGHCAVGSYAPNSWGLYDMHGNVSERCLDRNGETIGGDNPVGSDTGSFTLTKGGHWMSEAKYCISTNKFAIGDAGRSYGGVGVVGFRVALTLGELNFEISPASRDVDQE